MKEFKDIEFTTKPSQVEIKGLSPTKQRGISSLSSTNVSNRSSVTPEAVQLRVDKTRNNQTTIEQRQKANKLISVINLAQEATEEIGRIAESVDGIARQVESGEVSPQRREVLESEANNLISEIERKRKIFNDNNTIEPLENDEIKAEIEKKLGKSLDNLLPDNQDIAFDIGEIKLDMKENIVNIRTTVAKVQERIKAIQEDIEKASGEIQSIIDNFDVIEQNKEASQVSIRDLDNALKVAEETGNLIESSPFEALNSAGTLNHFAVNVLINNDDNS